MTAQQRILVTGHQGYIGSVMVPHLLRAGYAVTGLDTGYFNPCTLVPDPIRIPSLIRDVRALSESDLQGFHAVVHLAALSKFPIIARRPQNPAGTLTPAQRPVYVIENHRSTGTESRGHSHRKLGSSPSMTDWIPAAAATA